MLYMVSQENSYDPMQPDRVDNAMLGAVLTVGGLATSGIAINGIDQYEAQTSDEAIMSVTFDKEWVVFGKDEIYVTGMDVQHGALLVFGLATAGAGVAKIAQAIRMHRTGDK